MITKEIALNSTHRQIFHHLKLKNSDNSPVRCRVNCKCKTWVTRPDEFRLPVKYGLKDCFYLTQNNANDWQLA
jgi:hypothetical protein